RAGLARQRERVVAAVHLLETAAHVRETDAFCEPRIRVELTAHAVVLDRDREAVVVGAARERERAGAHLVAEAVDDGVLDERLEQHRGHRGRTHTLVAALVDGETVAEAHLHDRDVLPHQLELLVERDPMPIGALERLAEKAAEPPERLFGALVVALLDEHGHGVHRVEQEVRVDLHAQRLQLQLGEALTELARVELLLAHDLEEVADVQRRRERGVHDHVEQQHVVAEQEVTRVLPRLIRGHDGARGHVVIDDADAEAVHERYPKQQQRVCEQRERPVAGADGDARGAHGDERRKQDPRQPVIESEARQRSEESRREVAKREEPRDLLQRRVDGEADPDERQRPGEATEGGFARVHCGPKDYLKSKMSSSGSGRFMPSSKYSSQICAHGRSYQSGTRYWMTLPGATGWSRPFTFQSAC